MPKTAPDLTGQTFNDWTCLGFSENKRENNGRLYSCQCKCGAIFELNGYDLRKGKSKRCRVCSGHQPKDITGQTFGHLKVLSRAENLGVKTAWNCLCLHCNKECVIRTAALVGERQDGCSCQINYNKVNHVGKRSGLLVAEKIVGKHSNGQKLYHCVCDCGGTKDICGSDLSMGRVKSCGCLRLPENMGHKILGQKFGMLTLIAIGNKKNDKRTYVCLCDCGKTTEVITQCIISGKTQSCGCQMPQNKTDHSGKTFGRLTAISKFLAENKHMHYLCKCSCGEECVVEGGNLQKGHTKSCGCLQKELQSIRAKMQVGPLNSQWKGGGSITDRNCAQYSDWRNSVLERDNHCCQITGETEELEVHHLYSFVDNPDLRYDVDNGVTLSNFAHKLFHVLYGSGDNTPEQYASFKHALGV